MQSYLSDVCKSHGREFLCFVFYRVQSECGDLLAFACSCLYSLQILENMKENKTVDVFRTQLNI